MKICQRGMIYRKMAHLPPLIVMTKQNIQYLIKQFAFFESERDWDYEGQNERELSVFQSRLSNSAATIHISV